MWRSPAIAVRSVSCELDLGHRLLGLRQPRLSPRRRARGCDRLALGVARDLARLVELRARAVASRTLVIPSSCFWLRSCSAAARCRARLRLAQLLLLRASVLFARSSAVARPRASAPAPATAARASAVSPRAPRRQNPPLPTPPARSRPGAHQPPRLCHCVRASPQRLRLAAFGIPVFGNSSRPVRASRRAASSREHSARPSPPRRRS